MVESATSDNPHPSVEQLLQITDALLELDEWQRINAHLSECDKCNQRLTDLQENRGFGRLMERTFGRYRIIDHIAKGGMGDVYRAVALSDAKAPEGTIVALKTIRCGGGSEAMLAERFENERKYLETVQSLNDPHLVTLYEFGEQNGTPFIVMEYLPENLRERLATHPLSPLKMAGLVARLASATHAVHQAKIIHRDIKPANVLLDNQGNPKLADFGIAKITDVQNSISRTDDRPGSVKYMSPEQCDPSKGTVDVWTDIHALGVLLYEGLTGHMPYPGETDAEIIDRIINADPKLPRQIRPRISRDLERVCLKCLEKKPQARYSTASELAEHLNAITDRRSFRAPRPSYLTFRGMIGKRFRENPKTASLILGATSILLFTLPSLCTLWLAERQANKSLVISNGRLTESILETKENLLRARDAEELARENAASEQRARENAERENYMSLIQAAAAEFAAGRFGRAEQILDTCAPQSRNWEWRFLKSGCHPESVRIHGHRNAVRSVTFSPDGRFVLSAGEDRRSCLWDADTGEFIESFQGGSGCRSICVSAQKNWFAWPGDGWVGVFDLDNWSEVIRFRGADVGVTTMVFNADGSQLVTGDRRGVLRLWSLPEGMLVHEIGTHRTAVTAVALVGRDQLVSCSADGEIRLHQLDGSEIAVLAEPGASANAVTVSPDGKTIAVARLDGTVKIWQLPGVLHQRTLTLSSESIETIAFSPDSKWLAAAGEDRIIRLIRPQDGSVTHELRAHEDTILSVAFSADSQRLASSGKDQIIRIWDMPPRPSSREAKNLIPFVRSLRFAASGDTLVLGGDQGRIAVQATASGELLIPLDGGTSSVVNLVLSPSKRLVCAVGGDPKNDANARAYAGIWDLLTGERVLTLEGHQAQVTSIDWSRDGRLIVTGCNDRTVRVWMAISGQLVNHFTCDGMATQVAFTADSESVIASDSEGMLYLYDIKAWQEVWRRMSAGRKMKLAPDGSLFVTGWDGQAANIEVWSIPEGQIRYQMRGHARPITDIAFVPDGSRFFTTSNDGTVRIWDAALKRELVTVFTGEPPIQAVDFDESQQRLAFGGHRVHVLSGTYDKEYLRFHAGIGGIMDSSISPDGSQVVCAGWALNRCHYQVIDCSTGDQLAMTTIEGMNPSGMEWMNDTIVISANSPSVNSGKIFVWNPNSLDKPRVILDASEFRIGELISSPDRTRVACACTDGLLRIVDQFGQVLRDITAHDGSMMTVDWSPDGRYVVTGGWDTRLHVWLVATGSRICTYDGHESHVIAATFGHDGTRVYSSDSDGNVHSWNATTGAKLDDSMPIHRGSVTRLRVSSDGAFLASADNPVGAGTTTVKLWDLVSQKSVAVYPERWSCEFIEGPPMSLILSGKDGSVEIVRIEQFRHK